MKKALAILCTAALLLGCLFTGFAVSAETELTELTCADYGITAGTTRDFGGGDWLANTASDTLMNKSFTTMIVPTSYYPAIHIFSGWSGGLRIGFDALNDQMTLGNSNGASFLQTFTAEIDQNVPFKFQITMELVDEGLETEQLIVNVYIDDVQAVEDLVLTAETFGAEYPFVKTSNAFFNQAMIWYDVITPAAANELNTVPTAMLKKLSPSDLGVTKNALMPEVDATNAVLSTNVKLKVGNTMMYPANGWNGTQIDVLTPDSFTISDARLGLGFEAVTVNKSVADVPVVGNEINLKIATELVDEDYEGIYNDVRITYYVNDKSVFSYTEVAEAAKDAETDEILSENIGNGKFNIVDGKLMANLYINDMDLEDDTRIPVLAESQTDIKLNSTFNVDVTMAAETEVSISSLDMGHVGGFWRQNGMIYYNGGDGVVVAKQSYNGEKINFKVAVRAVDADGDGYADDTETGYYLDNELINDVIGKPVYELNNIEEYILHPVTVAAGGETVLTAPNQVPSGLTVITPSDAGWGGSFELGTEYGNSVPNNGQLGAGFISGNLVDKMFAANVKVEEASGIILLGLGDTAMLRINTPADGVNCGLQVLFNGNEWFFNGTESMAIGEEYLYQMTVEKADADLNEDGICNDLRFGYFLNGRLLNGRFYYASAANQSALDAYYTTAPAAWLQVYGEKFVADVESIDRSSELPEVKTLDITDIGLDRATYSVNSTGGNYIAATQKPLDDSIIDVDINVSSGTSGFEFVIGNYGHTGGGIRLAYNDTGASLNVILTADPTYQARVALPDFEFDTTQNYKISIELVNGGYKIGVWIDGVLQNNKFYYAVECGDSLINMAGFFMGDTTATRTISFDIANNEETVNYGSTYVVAPVQDGTVTLDGEEVTEAIELSDIGVYTVATNKLEQGANVVSEKTVAIYRENDLTGDGQVNVLDFIAMQKNIAEVNDLTVIGAYAAGVEYGERCTAAQLVALKKALLLAF